MADDEKLNSDILDGVCHEIIEEFCKDPAQKTKNLFSFMLSGKEPFHHVLDTFQRVEALVFVEEMEEEEQGIDCHIGIPKYDCDYKTMCLPFRNLPDFLLQLLSKYSTSFFFVNTDEGFGRKLVSLKDNKRLEAIRFGFRSDSKAIEAVLHHLTHIDQVFGSVRTFRAAAALKLDVNTIQVNEVREGDSVFDFQDFIVTHVSPEFTGLKNLDINCNAKDSWDTFFVAHKCQFERYMGQFVLFVKKYEADFPDLENFTFRIAADISDFFEETPYAYNKLFVQISIIENNLRTYTGRLKITFDCILQFSERIRFINDWKIETEKKLPGYVFRKCVMPYSKRNSAEFNKTTQLLPNVELKMTVRVYEF